MTPQQEEGGVNVQLTETERLERIAKLLGALPADHDVKGRTVALAYALAIDGRIDAYAVDLRDAMEKEPRRLPALRILPWINEYR
jgi:hypothetical protein